MVIENKLPQLVVRNKYDVPFLNLETTYNRMKSNPGSRLVEVRCYDWDYERYEHVGYIVSYPGDETVYLTNRDIQRMHDERLALWAKATHQTKEEKRMIEKQENEKLVCPICGQEYDDEPALDRRDNCTLICPDCGTRQSLEEMGLTESEQEDVLRRIHRFNESRREGQA